MRIRTRTSWDDRDKIARRFKRFRRQLKISQLAFGKLVGLGRTEVIHIEMARRYPHHTTLARFERLEENARHGKELARTAHRQGVQ